MKELSLKEKEIVVLLLHSPQTFDELEEKINLNYIELRNLMRKLLWLKIIEKRNGFPTKYSLKKEHWKKGLKYSKQLDMSSLLSNPCIKCNLD